MSKRSSKMMKPIDYSEENWLRRRPRERLKKSDSNKRLS